MVVNCYITSRGVFVNFERFLPLKKARGKIMAQQILKTLRDNNLQAFSPVIYLRDLEPIKQKLKGQEIKIELQDLSFIYKSDFKLMKEKLLKELEYK